MLCIGFSYDVPRLIRQMNSYIPSGAPVLSRVGIERQRLRAWGSQGEGPTCNLYAYLRYIFQ
jgi:hypothetical protein